MNVGTRTGRPLGYILRTLRYSSTTFTPAPSTAPIDLVSAPNPEHRTDLASESTTHTIAAGVLLSRPPFLTPTLHQFEESYYFYQRRLNQRLVLPFTRYFYFKKDSPADLEWKRKQKALLETQGGRWTGFGERGWADELLVGDELQKRPEDLGWKRAVETTVTGEDSEESGRAQIVREGPLSRITKADREGDTKSLDRKGERTLYLMVKKKGQSHYGWKLPQGRLQGKENLREAASRTLAEVAGVNMNTWFVGNVPVGHHVYSYPTTGYDGDAGKTGKKVFYMKARIMAGQADLSANIHGYEEFAWLTKEEIQKQVHDWEYFKAIKNMLVDR